MKTFLITAGALSALYGLGVLLVIGPRHWFNWFYWFNRFRNWFWNYRNNWNNRFYYILFNYRLWLFNNRFHYF